MAERKTAKQIAEEALETGVRVLERAKARKEKVDAENPALIEKYTALIAQKQADIVSAAEAVKAAEKRVAFLGTNPDLDEPQDDDAVL
jgi:ribonucleotide monophosphatase NagD (HAD superfamily)